MGGGMGGGFAPGPPPGGIGGGDGGRGGELGVCGDEGSESEERLVDEGGVGEESRCRVPQRRQTREKRFHLRRRRLRLRGQRQVERRPAVVVAVADGAAIGGGGGGGGGRRGAHPSSHVLNDAGGTIALGRRRAARPIALSRQ